MTDYSELDDLVDMVRETIAATREDNARIAAFQHDQFVAWDRLSYVDESDWRTFNGLT